MGPGHGFMRKKKMKANINHQPELLVSVDGSNRITH